MALHGIPAPLTISVSSPLLFTRIPAPPQERWGGGAILQIAAFFYKFETSDYFHGAWITNM